MLRPACNMWVEHAKEQHSFWVRVVCQELFESDEQNEKMAQARKLTGSSSFFHAYFLPRFSGPSSRPANFITKMRRHTCKKRFIKVLLEKESSIISALIQVSMCIYFCLPFVRSCFSQYCT